MPRPSLELPGSLPVQDCIREKQASKRPAREKAGISETTCPRPPLGPIFHSMLRGHGGCGGAHPPDGSRHRRSPFSRARRGPSSATPGRGPHTRGTRPPSQSKHPIHLAPRDAATSAHAGDDVRDQQSPRHLARGPRSRHRAGVPRALWQARWGTSLRLPGSTLTPHHPQNSASARPSKDRRRRAIVSPSAGRSAPP